MREKNKKDFSTLLFFMVYHASEGREQGNSNKNTLDKLLTFKYIYICCTKRQAQTSHN